MNFFPISSSSRRNALAANFAMGQDGFLFTPRPGGCANVKDFGAVGDGIADDSTAINAALSSGSSSVCIPAGTYKILSTITIPNGVSIEGAGVGVVLLDGSGATYSNLTSGDHIKTQGGTLTQIQSLANNASKGDRQLVFTSAPDLSPGDIFVIYNPTDYSWAPARPTYRAGEMLRVAKVDGSTVTVHGTLFDDYLSSAVNVYRLDDVSSCKLSGFTLKGLAGTSGPVTGIDLLNAVNSVIEDVRVTNCSYGQVVLKGCLGVQLRNVICEEDFTADFATDYGLVISNSQSIDVTGGYYVASRHGITSGGGNSVGDVPCRVITVRGAEISSTGDSSAADFHGNTEYAGFDNCIIDGGVTLRGDYVSLTNSKLHGTNGADGIPVYCSEHRGFNFRIEGNTIRHKAAYYATGFGSLIHFATPTNPPKGGVFAVKNNILHWEISDSNVNHEWLNAFASGYVGAEPIECDVSGNTLRVIGTGQGAYAEISALASGNPWDFVTLRDNNITGSGLLYLRHTGAAGFYSALKLIVEGNSIADFYTFGIYAEDVKEYVSVKNNHITGGSLRTVQLSGAAGFPCRHIDVSGNTFLDNRSLRNGDSTDAAGVVVNNATYAAVHDNISGSFNEYLAVGSNVGFVVGETVTGATSGATAVVSYLRSTTELMIGLTRSGTFVAENITGSISGTTTNVTATGFTTAYRNSFSTIDLLYEANNSDTRLSADYRSAITAYAPGSVLTGSATYNPPSLADGDGVTTTVAVSGAAIGDHVLASFSLDVQGIMISAWVSAANTVSVRLQNESGGVVDLASGTLRARVTKL